MPFLKHKEKVAWIILGMVAAGSGWLMVQIAQMESAIMDELAHIPAGYGYVKYLDHRLNPEHPPLIKAFAALPLIFLDLRFPATSPLWQNDVNAQWDIGAKFLYDLNGERADTIIFFSRLFPILLTLLLTLSVYLWTREMFGSWWGLLPASLVAFSPHFLSHGHYVTTDVGAALGFFVSIWFFIKFLSSPSTRLFWWAGFFFGIAQLLKFSTVLLLPLFVFLALLFWIARTKEHRDKIFSLRAVRRLGGIVLKVLGIFLTGFLLVAVVYTFFNVNQPVAKQTHDTKFILQSFAGGPNPLSCSLSTPSIRCLAEITTEMASNPITKGVAEYFLGVLMVLQRSSGGNNAYFLGELGSGGWTHYFPSVFLLKESLPALLMMVAGLFLAVFRFFRHRITGESQRFFQYVSMNFAEISMLSFIVLYWAYSIQSPLNIGFRHILPTIPFLYILAAGSLKKWIDAGSRDDSRRLFSITPLAFLGTSLKKTALGFLIVWVGVETLFAYPYFMSYFNQVGSGVFGGYRYVTDSNYDWGQDLIRLKNFVNHPPGGETIEKIAVDYFGGGSVSYYLKEKGVNWSSSRGNPLEERIRWLAVSINSLQSARAEKVTDVERRPEDEYRWLTQTTPYARAGTSIFIYRLQ